MTERPDKAAAALLEGRVVLVVDNTPFVILLPVTLNLFFQAAEDYYDRWEIMSLIRFMRYVAAFVAVALPGLYLALTVYHPELLPTSLALKIATTRQSIPFQWRWRSFPWNWLLNCCGKQGCGCHHLSVHHWHRRGYHHRFGGGGRGAGESGSGHYFRSHGNLLFCHSQYFRGFWSAAE